MLEYNLIISGIPHFIKEDCIRNWDEISYSMKRDGFTGIVRSFSSQFEFTNAAYNYLLEEFFKNKLNATAQIEIYELDNNRGKVFLFGSHLDFASLEYDDDAVYINGADSTLASKIKAKRNTRYEYPVSELKETAQLDYDRLIMLNRTEWIYTGEYGDTPRGKAYINRVIGAQLLPMYIKSSEISTKGVVNVKDSFNDGNTDKTTHYFFCNSSAVSQNVKIHVGLTFYLFDEGKADDVSVYLIVKNPQGNNVDILKECTMNRRVGMQCSFKYDGSIVLIPGHRLALQMEGLGAIYQLESDSSVENVTVEFEGKNRNELIDVIKPVTVLNRLLKSINDGKDGFVGEIENTDKRLAETLFVPAESIRGIGKAKVYLSIKKFSEWMETVFGYVPVIEGNKFVYRKRDNLYNNTLQCSLDNQGYDFNVKLESSNVYSKLKIGFEKQDYDNVNGRDEFRFSTEYDTGITMTDNILEMISPLRADAYGLEFLIEKRGEETKDDTSDKDLFFVCARLNGPKYKLVRGEHKWDGIINGWDMFNMMFSPRACVEANKGYLASFMRNLTFASSEGNSTAEIDFKPENGNIALAEQDALFTASTLSVETANGKIPTDVHGLVEVKRNGYLYTCFVNEINYKLGIFEGVQYNLQIKKITAL